MNTFLRPFAGALVFAIALAGCDAVAPEASGDLALTNASGIAAAVEAGSSATVEQEDTVTGPSTIYIECVSRYYYSNTNNDFTVWRIKGLGGNAEIVDTGWDYSTRIPRPYVDVVGTVFGTFQIRAYNDTSSPFYIYKTVTYASTLACA